jgi:hypothetical protein
MKKILALAIAVAGIMVGCTQQDDMSSPPAAPATNNPATNQ